MKKSTTVRGWVGLVVSTAACVAAWSFLPDPQAKSPCWSGPDVGGVVAHCFDGAETHYVAIANRGVRRFAD